MPMPGTYRHADAEWQAFLEDIQEILGTPSSNVAYTAAEGILTSFRRRLKSYQVLEFFEVLPCVIRSLFLQGWRMEAPIAWAERSTYIDEALALRKNHNFAGDKVHEAVAYALHRALGYERLRRALANIGPEAKDFWKLLEYHDTDPVSGFRSPPLEPF